ncbi:MAG: ADP-ribosyltransferase [Solirubrobacterales bacterium]
MADVERLGDPGDPARRRSDGPANPFGEHLAKIHAESKIPADIREIARLYTRKGVAKEINSALREGRPLKGMAREVADALDTAFEYVKPTTQEGTIFRGLRGTLMSDYVVGNYRKPPPEFTSTSLSLELASRYASEEGRGDIWEVVVKPGSHVLEMNLLIGSQQSHEDEVLIPTGAHLKVVKARNRTDGFPGKVVTLELWPH